MNKILKRAIELASEFAAVKGRLGSGPKNAKPTQCCIMGLIAESLCQAYPKKYKWEYDKEYGWQFRDKMGVWTGCLATVSVEEAGLTRQQADKAIGFNDVEGRKVAIEYLKEVCNESSCA